MMINPRQRFSSPHDRISGKDVIEASEGRIELFTQIVREAGTVALDEAILGAMPFAENVGRIVELGRMDSPD
jgi:hypothetical protein